MTINHLLKIGNPSGISYVCIYDATGDCYVKMRFFYYYSEYNSCKIVRIEEN